MIEFFGNVFRNGSYKKLAGNTASTKNAMRLHQVLNPPADATQRNAAKLPDANDTRSSAVKRNASRLAALIGSGKTR